MTGILPLSSGIEIGKHVEREFLGMTFNMDTIWTTFVAGGLVLLLGLVARNALTKDPDDHVPTKVQLLWEAVVGQVNKEVEANLGRLHPVVVPTAVALFFFILFANWLEVIPTHVSDSLHLLPPPTADTNLTYAMAIMCMVGVWAYGIQQKGVKGYFKHFVQPFPVLLPLNILEELIKPITLALRLFGNIFAGGIMISLIALMPVYALWAPNIVWKLFEMFIGGIQAFIFSLLVVLYFGMAAAGHEEEHAEADEDETDETDETDERATAPAH